MAIWRSDTEKTNYDKNLFKILIITFFAISLIGMGFIFEPPDKVFNGIIKIVLAQDSLITDYFVVGGMGAALVNSGLLTIIFILLLIKLKINFNGVTYAALFLVAGFALFGKNVYNVWFIVLGVFLYSIVQREKFSKYIYIALFGTALSPVATEIMIITKMSTINGMILGGILATMIGFILPPLTIHLIKTHMGYNLYNVGFTAGIIGTIIVSVLRSYDYESTPQLIWSTFKQVEATRTGFVYIGQKNYLLGIDNYHILIAYLFSLFIIMIVCGFILNEKSFRKYNNIIKYSGRLVSDFVILEGLGLTLINMGILGILSTSYILLINGNLNGPTIGGIFTIVGFAAFGKHPKNIIPIILGVYLGSLTKSWELTDPSIQLAALFATGLAPIAGEYGWLFGILAGYLHSSVVLNVGHLHGGLNLYNNGFAAGIVAAVMVPIIEAFRKDDSD